MILPPDQVVDYKPSHCGRLGTSLAGDDPDPSIDQVIELPEKLRRGTPYPRHTLGCPLCQARTTATPVPETTNGFGPRIQAATAYFSRIGRFIK